MNQPDIGDRCMDSALYLKFKYASRFKNYDKEPFGERKVVGIGGVWAPTERSLGSTPHGIPVQAFGGGEE